MPLLSYLTFFSRLHHILIKYTFAAFLECQPRHSDRLPIYVQRKAALTMIATSSNVSDTDSICDSNQLVEENRGTTPQCLYMLSHDRNLS